MPLGIQVFGLLFSLFILYMSFLYYKKKEFTLTEMGFWSAFSVLFGIVAIFPEIINPVVATLELGRKLDLFIILGFMFLVSATFYTYSISRRTEKRMESLVRKIALENAEKKK